MSERGLFDLTGRVVVATGGNSGIGLGFLTGCAKQGADVVTWDRNADGHDAALETLERAGAGRTLALTVDVSDEEQVAGALAETVGQMGRIDAALANAGFTTRAESFPDMTTAMWHELLAVNLHGAFYTLRDISRHMRDRAQAGDPGGSIVVTGSLSMFHGIQGMEHYAAAKGALATVVRGMAVELGQYGIRVNMIAPGFIMTTMTADSPESKPIIEHMAKITPLGRPGDPTDIEGPAAYLASDASKFQTGDTLVLDGGRLVKNL